MLDSSVIERVRQLDIREPLALLPSLQFKDTGGTNGWIADETQILPFVSSLNLGRVLRVQCRLLPPWQGIPPHIDRPFGEPERRFHVPLITHTGVTMRWPGDGVEEHLEAGWLYEVRFDREHEIVHRADIGRVHIQINVAG